MGLAEIVEGVRWEKENKMHITLKFVGNMDTSMISSVKEIISSICAEFDSIMLINPKLSAFPNFKRPRVVVLTFDDNDRLTRLSNMIQDKFEILGIPKDVRAFIPHVTLGRVKNSFRMNAEPEGIENFGLCIEEIALVESRLDKKGSVYSNLGVYKLT